MIAACPTLTARAVAFAKPATVTNAPTVIAACPTPGMGMGAGHGMGMGAGHGMGMGMGAGHGLGCHAALGGGIFGGSLVPLLLLAGVGYLSYKTYNLTKKVEQLKV
ncbi:MAG: hypothetical protein HN353_11515 [Bdellovibrionales bacterium]|jgi:hypothetical protein|nr:hypothetical protein [Bdellovibrionales bacterium]MBT3525716.1 hypothetical protein [Bdellovibrionales bacterium]MBT7670445.1 hypothetical protein [Bdellovibrionales bacterium]MBT7766199.1 hypothetical protein [Bdellovibrionales bacterium]